MRAPWALTFSVRPSWAGWRTSKLQRSTLTVRGMRFSNRRAIACMRHPIVLRKIGRMGAGGGNDLGIIPLPGRNRQEFEGPRGFAFRNPETPYILANLIHDSTAGLWTPPRARGKIRPIQRILICGSLCGAATLGIVVQRESGGRA